jgi:hypothetical protein
MIRRHQILHQKSNPPFFARGGYVKTVNDKILIEARNNQMRRFELSYARLDSVCSLYFRIIQFHIPLISRELIEIYTDEKRRRCSEHVESH